MKYKVEIKVQILKLQKLQVPPSLNMYLVINNCITAPIQWNLPRSCLRNSSTSDIDIDSYIDIILPKDINKCSTRCNTKQSIYYSASSLYMFRVSTTPIIRSTQICNRSLRYWSCSYLPPTWPSLATLQGGRCTKNMTNTGGCSYSFVYSWWWVWLTPETCRVNLQNNT